MAKAFFQEHDIIYAEHNVLADASARSVMLEKSGQAGVPVILVDDDEVVIGFDKSRLSELLGISE